MKSTTRFASVTKEQIQELSSQLKGHLSEEEPADFTEYMRPYSEFGYDQLDNIFIIAEVTLEGNGEVISLTPVCNVDQSEWWMYEDEADIRIDPVVIPLTLVTPLMPLNVSGSTTFLAVVKAENNVWDLCKDLPEWIWNEGKFEFMLWFTVTTADGKVYEGNRSGEYANQLIGF